MVLGWQIFVHALRMVFRNWRDALRIVVGPALLAIVVIALSLILAGSGGGERGEDAGGLVRQVTTGSDVLTTAIFFLANVLASIWIAIAWHRFILLEEYPKGFFPAFRPDMIIGYFVKSLVIGLVVSGILLVGVFLPSLILGDVLGSGLLVVIVLATVYAILVFMRLSVILPALAVGQPLSLSQAWAETKGAGGAFAVVAFVPLIFSVVIDFGITLISFVPVIEVVLTVLISSILVPLIGVSILTTLYGVFVEKRELT